MMKPTRMTLMALVVVGLAAGGAQADPVIWDNGPADPTGTGSPASQLDSVYPFEAQSADDFNLPTGPNGEPQWLITDVHWSGSYFSGNPNAFDFNVLFYADNGIGTAPTGGPGDPTGTALSFESFANAQVNETPTGVLNANNNEIFDYSVDLGTPFLVDAGTQYWLAVQSVGVWPPQWAWQGSTNQQLAEAVQGFPMLGINYWTDPADASVGDLAFQLTGVPVPEPATAGLLALGMLLPVVLRRRRRQR